MFTLFLLLLGALLTAALVPAASPSAQGPRKELITGLALLGWGPAAGFPGAVPWAALALAHPEETPDLKLYRAVVRRVHRGDSYYVAAPEELRKRGYPTRSVFNFRPPTYAWLFAAFPGPTWIQVVLGCGSLAVAMLTFTMVTRESGLLLGAVVVLLLGGLLLWCLVDDAFFSQELWAGALIVLSVAAYGLGNWPGGVAAGLAALFFRELALPYCLIAAGFALWKGRRRELASWIVGLTLFAAFLLWHAHAVAARHTAEDERIVSEGWLRFGGLRFVLATVRMNRFLFGAPYWVLAIYLSLSLLGLAGWGGETGLRVALTVATFVLTFTVVGNPRINDYWGLLYAGLLPFGLAWAPVALLDLARCMRRQPGASDEAGR